MKSNEKIVEDFKSLSIVDLIEKYLENYTLDIRNILKTLNFRVLVIILIICKYNLNLNTFIENNNEFIKKIFTPNDLNNNEIKYAFEGFNSAFNMFVNFDFISINNKEEYLINNFLNTTKTHYRNITAMYNFVTFLSLIKNEKVTDYIEKYGLEKLIFIELLFNYTKDFNTQGLTIFSFTGDIYKEFPLLIKNLNKEGYEGIVVNYLNNQLNIKNEGIQNEIVKCIKNIFKYLNNDVNDDKNILIYLCNYFNYNNLTEIIDFVAQNIDKTVVEDCNEIYNEFEKNDNFGAYKKGCCYDIGGNKCKNFQVNNGYCLCNETFKKYLKYKNKYLLLKNKLI